MDQGRKSKPTRIFDHVQFSGGVSEMSKWILRVQPANKPPIYLCWSAGRGLARVGLTVAKRQK